MSGIRRPLEVAVSSVEGDESRVVFDNADLAQQVYGPGGEHLEVIGEEARARLDSRGCEVQIQGTPSAIAFCRSILLQLYRLAHKGCPLSRDDVRRAVQILREDNRVDLTDIFHDAVFVGTRHAIAPKGLAQKRYVEAIRTHDVVFGIGPAGTGKTYLAMAMALSALQRKAVKRLVLTRPAVEAGERLGFLPGSMEEKVHPYLRPLYDALQDMTDFDRTRNLMERGIIEVAPLAFMRGRTLNDAFVVLDEAQNTTSDQMLMFLTRLGYHSKAVVIGDITQSDLPEGKTSGLREARDLLKDISGITFCTFTEVDVVRHPLVQRIIKAYETRPGRL